MFVPFSPPPGLNSDDTSFKAEGRWADGNNVRFTPQPQVIGEFKALFSALGGAIYNIFAWDRAGTVYFAYGRDANVYVGAGAASPTDRTPASMGSGYRAYAFASWGSTLLFVPSGKTLYEQSGTSTATEVTQSPNKINWMLVTPQRQALAFGCDEEASGTYNGLCIRGSDLEDYTDWTTTATNNAFEHILDDGGEIVTARLIGPYVAVWTKSDLHMGQFLGNPSQTYRFDLVAGEAGAIGPNAVVVVGQRAYWIGHDLQLRTWGPGAEMEIIPCPIYRDFLASLAGNGSLHLIALVHVTKFNEIWIQWQNAGTGGYIAYSLSLGTWFKGDVERYSVLCSDLVAHTLNATYGSNFIAADVNGVVYAHECGVELTQDGPTAWHIKSADQYLDTGGRRTMIRSFRPDFEQASGAIPTYAVSLTVYVRDRPQSTAVTKGPYSVAAGATKYDLRASGMIVDVKFSQGTGVDRELRIGKCAFDVVPLGER